ncbi:MAG: YgfZ/GcvT domain-containing protein [Fimbriimonas sp.]
MSDVTNAISEQALRDYDRLRDDCGLIRLPGLGHLELTGDDRKGWLQGQVTNNVRRLESGNSISFCITTPSGHLLSVVDAWAVQDRFFMTCARETLPAVLQRVEQMVVLEDVEARDAAEAYNLLSIQGPTASRRLGELVPLPSLDAGESRLGETRIYCLRSDRTGLGGWDVWVPTEAQEARRTLEDAFETIGGEAYNIARLEAGLPLFGLDMNERTLPPEMGPAFENRHVSYNKGCYVGQEVLMRIHSRGHTNKTWVGLSADGPLEVGGQVSHPNRRDAGTVTSAVFSPDYGHIGAAMVRNEAAREGELVRVLTERGEVEAEVRQMPILRLD